MKSNLQLLEECIEEKTKEYYQVAAQLTEALENTSSSSFGNAKELMSTFDTQQRAKQVRSELGKLLEQHAQLSGDFTEQEAILGTKGEVLKHLSELPDGLYRLMKVERKKGNGEE